MNQNTGLTRLVVLFLGLITLAVIVGSFVLAYNGTDIPAALIGLGGTALGGLGGILVSPGGAQALTSGTTATVEEAVAAATPAPPDFGPLREQLGDAANKLLAVAHALGDPAATPPDEPPG